MYYNFQLMADENTAKYVLFSNEEKIILERAPVWSKLETGIL